MDPRANDKSNRSLAARLARRALSWLAVPSLLLLFVTLLLWWRSFGALDSLEGSVRFTRFTIDTYGGRLEALVTRPYRVRPSARKALRRADGTLGIPAWGQLEFDKYAGYRSDYVGRQRWPIERTSKWPLASRLFPAPDAKAWTTLSRGAPGEYTGCLSVTVPYWLATLALAVAPTVWIVGIVRRRRRMAMPHACLACGYDCRASPDRCPECGTPRAAEAA